MDIKKYSDKELKELKSQLELEMTKREKPTNKKHIEMFYDSFDGILKKHNIKSMPYSIFKKQSSNWTLFENTYKIFNDFIITNYNLKIVEWFALYNFFLNMVVNIMKDRGVILTPHSILSYAQYLPSLVETGFPGWIASGMFPLIIKLIIKKTKDGFEDGEEDS